MTCSSFGENIVISGAGLVGPMLAVCFARRGLRVTIYDRQPAPRLVQGSSGRSINITLCGRGLKALEMIGARDAVEQATLPVYGRAIHDMSGGITFQPYGNRGEALFAIRRKDLNRILLEFSTRFKEINYVFGKKCSAVHLDTGEIELHDAATGQTSRVATSPLIGADGVFSPVRLAMQHRDRFNFAQLYVDQGYREFIIDPSPEMPWTRQREVMHLWPRDRFMLVGFPNCDGTFTLALHLPFQGEVSFAAIQTEDEFLELVSRFFPDVSPAAPKLAPQYVTRPSVSMITVMCRPWSYQDTAVLIGDAAHAVVPYYGQGANAGFEDCAVFSQCMDAHPGDRRAVFAEYERQRYPNAVAMAQLSLQHGRELEQHAGDARFLLRKELERALNQRYPDRYMDLYSMISFSDLCYTEALRIDAAQRVLLERLLATPEVLRRLDEPQVRAMIEVSFEEIDCVREGRSSARPLSAQGPTSEALPAWDADQATRSVLQGFFV